MQVQVASPMLTMGVSKEDPCDTSDTDEPVRRHHEVSHTHMGPTSPGPVALSCSPALDPARRPQVTFRQAIGMTSGLKDYYNSQDPNWLYAVATTPGRELTPLEYLMHQVGAPPDTPRSIAVRPTRRSTASPLLGLAPNRRLHGHAAARGCPPCNGPGSS